MLRHHSGLGAERSGVLLECRVASRSTGLTLVAGASDTCHAQSIPLAFIVIFTSVQASRYGASRLYPMANYRVVTEQSGGCWVVSFRFVPAHLSGHFVRNRTRIKSSRWLILYSAA
jgi:hypothetical protein